MRDAQHRASLGMACGCGERVVPDLVALGVHIQMVHPQDWEKFKEFVNSIGAQTAGMPITEATKVIQRLADKMFGRAP